jgi:PST family polysaccharide transporter
MEEFFTLTYFKNFFKSPTKRRLAENFFSLSILQALNYLLPLITLPYLVRVLGATKYGLIAFAQAFIGYFQILTDYGFNLSATREISINRENKEKISEIFSSVMIIKFCLLFASLLLMSAIVFSFSKFRQDWLVYYLTFGMVLGQVLFPVWFFQGMERMKYITFLNIIAKTIFTVAIFLFVKIASDYLYVPLLSSLGFIIAGFLSFLIVFKDFGVRFMIPSFDSLKHQLIEGWHIFLSTVAISLYTTSNAFILGLFTNNTIVGYYAAAEKIIRAVLGFLGPISQTIYPYLSKLMNSSKEAGIKFIRKITALVGSLSFVLSLSIFLFSDLIVKFILGTQYTGSIIVLKILSFLPFIVGLSNIFGIQTMLTLNYKKAFSNILVTAGIINVGLSILLVPILKHVGTSIAFLLTEIFVTISMLKFLESKGITILNTKIVCSKIYK